MNGGLFLGAFLGIMGSVMSVSGLILQRLSQRSNERLPSEQRKSALRQGKNVLGLLLMAVGAMSDATAFGFAPQSFLAPFGSITLVMNAVAAPYFLKEKVDRRDVFATVCVFSGVLVSLMFSNHSTPIYTYVDLVSMFMKALMLAYTIMFFSAVGLMVGNIYFFSRTHYLKPGLPRKVSIAAVGLARFSSEPESSAELDNDFPDDDNGSDKRSCQRACVRLSFPVLAGVFGGGSVLFAKAVIELVRASATGNEGGWNTAVPYLLFLGVGSFLGLQVVILNRSLRLFEAFFVVPVYQTFWVFANICNGAFYYGEMRSFSVQQWVMYPVGLTVMFIGVYFLAKRPANDHLQEGLMPSGGGTSDSYGSARKLTV